MDDGDRGMMLDQARLVAAGWQTTLSGRWHHADIPCMYGRKRLFTTNDALALLDASDAVSSEKKARPALHE